MVVVHRPARLAGRRAAARQPVRSFPPRGRPMGCLIACAAIAVSGCVTPATGTGTYEAKASMTLEAASSELETARLTVEAFLAHRVFRPYADETVTAAETALGSISAAFGSVQPPPE